MPQNSENLILPNQHVADLLQEVCSKGHTFTFSATGGSMAPFICHGDTIIISPYSKKRSIEIGDIVAFIDSDTKKLIIHRVIKKQDSKFLIKGDNVYQADGFFTEKNFHGYVKKVTILRKKLPFFRKSLRIFFQFLNKFKFFLAFLSYWKILTPLCRIQNKLFR